MLFSRCTYTYRLNRARRPQGSQLEGSYISLLFSRSIMVQYAPFQPYQPPLPLGISSCETTHITFCVESCACLVSTWSLSTRFGEDSHLHVTGRRTASHPLLLSPPPGPLFLHSFSLCVYVCLLSCQCLVSPAAIHQIQFTHMRQHTLAYHTLLSPTSSATARIVPPTSAKSVVYRSNSSSTKLRSATCSFKSLFSFPGLHSCRAFSTN